MKLWDTVQGALSPILTAQGFEIGEQYWVRKRGESYDFFFILDLGYLAKTGGSFNFELGTSSTPDPSRTGHRIRFDQYLNDAVKEQFHDIQIIAENSIPLMRDWPRSKSFTDGLLYANQEHIDAYLRLMQKFLPEIIHKAFLQKLS